jgi:hypothetical protein
LRIPFVGTDKNTRRDIRHAVRGRHDARSAALTAEGRRRSLEYAEA